MEESILRPSLTGLRIGLGEERIERRREFFEPPDRHARIPDGIGMCAVVCHRGGIESGLLIDKDDRRFGAVFVGNQCRQIPVQHCNGRDTGRGDELRQQDADVRVHRPQDVDDAADVADRTGDTLPLGEVVGSNTY